MRFSSIPRGPLPPPTQAPTQRLDRLAKRRFAVRETKFKPACPVRISSSAELWIVAILPCNSTPDNREDVDWMRKMESGGRHSKRVVILFLLVLDTCNQQLWRLKPSKTQNTRKDHQKRPPEKTTRKPEERLGEIECITYKGGKYAGGTGLRREIYGRLCRRRSWGAQVPRGGDSSGVGSEGAVDECLEPRLQWCHAWRT